MGLLGRAGAALLLGLAAVVPVAGLAAGAVGAAGTSSDRLDPAYDQGIARAPDGWILSGRDLLARVDDHFVVQARAGPAIPAAWQARGYDHVGDVDVAGTTLYVPFEQANGDLGKQVMARYDARTLVFRDATVVSQHENSFVTVDRATGIAYSMDRFGGDALTRYDVRSHWRPLAPLRLDRTLDRVQGASVARGAVWLSTDDARNGVYRVDLRTGAVSDVGSAEPVAGEGEGVDAADVVPDDVHVTVVAADRSLVALDHFDAATRSAQSADPGVRPSTSTDTSWPPALVYFAIGLVVVGLGAVGTVFWRARRTIHG